MTEQEKELDKVLFARAPYIEGEDRKFLITDIIKCFPQILAEKVWEGNQSDFLVGMWDKQIKFKGKNVQVFIREVVS